MPPSTSAGPVKRCSCGSGPTAHYSPSAPDTVEVATFFGVIEAGRHSAPFSSAKPVVDSRNPALVAVGAIDPADGSGGIAFYSSQGPTNDGRIKPDVSAPSCVRSTIYPSPNCFNGTSAASPAAAGVAALLFGRGLALAGMPLASLVKHLVVDLGPPGPDNAYGTGEIRLPAPPVAGQLAAELVHRAAGARSSPRHAAVRALPDRRTWSVPIRSSRSSTCRSCRRGGACQRDGHRRQRHVDRLRSASSTCRRCRRSAARSVISRPSTSPRRTRSDRTSRSCRSARVRSRCSCPTAATSSSTRWATSCPWTRRRRHRGRAIRAAQPAPGARHQTGGARPGARRLDPAPAGRSANASGSMFLPTPGCRPPGSPPSLSTSRQPIRSGPGSCRPSPPAATSARPRRSTTPPVGMACKNPGARPGSVAVTLTTRAETPLAGARRRQEHRPGSTFADRRPVRGPPSRAPPVWCRAPGSG